MSNRYQALIKQREDAKAGGEAVFAAAEAAGRVELSAEEIAQVTAAKQRVADLTAQITLEESRRAFEREAPADVVVPAASGRIESVRDLALERPWGHQWAQAGAPADVVKAAGVGEFLQAVYRASTGRGLDPRLAMNAALGASETVGADGGFLVARDMADDIRMRMLTGELLSRVDRVPLSGNANSITVNMLDESSRATGSRFGGVTGYWVDEATAATASKPTFWKYKLELNKLAALGYATDELLADAVAIGRIFPQAFAEELRFLTENAIFAGTGAGQPQGIKGHAATVSVAKETGQAAATIVFENVLKMWSRMPAALRANAVWHINQEAEPQLAQMGLAIGTGGVPVYLPAGGAADSPLARLFSRPIVPLEYCSALGTVGDIVLANWGEYGFADKGGVQQDSSMHVAFTTGEMAFRAFYRLDGRPKWRTVLTPFSGASTATLGPFVTLATRA